MTERIVRCAGCGKQYRIPPGVAIPAVAMFECLACGTKVPYGTGGGGQPPRAPARSDLPARDRGRGRRAGASSRARRAAPGQAPARRTSQGPPLAGILGIVALLVAVVVLVKMLPETRAPSWIAPEHAAEAASAAKDVAHPLPRPAPVGPQPPAAQPAPAPRPATMPFVDLSKLDGDLLFHRVDDVPGVSPDARAAIDRDVALLVKRDSARAGVEARARLLAAGRTAVPALLNVFGEHWRGERWSTADEKFASYAVQQLLTEITKADAPNAFVARFDDERLASPSEDFDRAARMWANWWNTRGKGLERFREFPE